MNLRNWRIDAKLSQRELAELLGISGTNPARTLQRYESGETAMPTATLFHLAAVTNGEVTAQDMHEVRLAWLKANKPGALLPVAQEVRA